MANPNPNQSNLITQAQRTPEERSKIARMGAIASNEAQRKRKELKETLKAFLEIENNQDNMCLAILKKAMDGDTKAFEVIRDTIGEKPIDKSKISFDENNLTQVLVQFVGKNETSNRTDTTTICTPDGGTLAE